MSGYILLVFISLFLIFLLKTTNKKYDCLKELTLLKGCYPIIGHWIILMKKDLLKTINEIVEEKSPCVVWQGPKPIFLTDDPEHIKIILNNSNSMDKSWVFEFLKEIFGHDSIILTQFSNWRKVRKTLSKAFHQNILDSFVYIFYEKSNILIDILKRSDCSTKKMDLLSIFEKYSMDSFLLANTGADEQLQIIENSELIEGLYKGQELALERVFHPHLWSDFIFKIVGKMQKLRKYVAITSEFLTKVMNARKVVKKNVQEYAGLKSKPIMDLMLDIHEFKDSYIINEMRTFFYAAVETSGSSLAFTCILLGMNQDVQTRCYEEVIDVVGINKQIEFSDLPKLKYLDMVLSESLRILPIVPYIGRHSSAPLDLNGVTIPEDIDILIPIFRLHRNPKYYPDPLKFNPERFSPEQIAKRPQYAYIPFSGGPRNCIGWKYATMMMKTTLANIVRNFEIQSSYKNVEDIRLEAQILIRAVDTMDCKFVIRK